MKTHVKIGMKCWHKARNLYRMQNPSFSEVYISPTCNIRESPNEIHPFVWVFRITSCVRFFSPRQGNIADEGQEVAG